MDQKYEELKADIDKQLVLAMNRTYELSRGDRYTMLATAVKLINSELDMMDKSLK